MVLIAAFRRRLMGSYRHPWWAAALGGLAWGGAMLLAYQAVRAAIG